MGLKGPDLRPLGHTPKGVKASGHLAVASPGVVLLRDPPNLAEFCIAFHTVDKQSYPPFS